MKHRYGNITSTTIQTVFSSRTGYTFQNSSVTLSTRDIYIIQVQMHDVAPPANPRAGNGKVSPPFWRERQVICKHQVSTAILWIPLELHTLPLFNNQTTGEVSCEYFLWLSGTKYTSNIFLYNGNERKSTLRNVIVIHRTFKCSCSK